MSTSPSAARSDSARRVLDAALALFGEQGFEGTSLQQIADRLGVTKAAVYYHFRSKEDLLVGLIEPTLDELVRTLSAARALTGARARQRRALEVYVDHLLRHRALASWLSQDAAALVHLKVSERVQQVDLVLTELLTGSCDDPLSRFWGTLIARSIGGALIGDPEAPEPWLRQQIAVLAEHLLAAHRAAVRRSAACPPLCTPA